MDAQTSDLTPLPTKSPDDSFKESLACLEAMLDGHAEGPVDSRCCETLQEELQKLHARFRAHDASGYLSSVDAVTAVAPELAEETTRLRDEHSRILGQLDWLVRKVESIPDRPSEDQDVFMLRLRELIAVLRRHEAEEDRVFYLAMWRDTGGEGG